MMADVPRVQPRSLPEDPPSPRFPSPPPKRTLTTNLLPRCRSWTVLLTVVAELLESGRIGREGGSTGCGRLASRRSGRRGPSIRARDGAAERTEGRKSQVSFLVKLVQCFATARTIGEGPRKGPTFVPGCEPSAPAPAWATMRSTIRLR